MLLYVLMVCCTLLASLLGFSAGWRAAKLQRYTMRPQADGGLVVECCTCGGFEDVVYPHGTPEPRGAPQRAP